MRIAADRLSLKHINQKLSEVIFGPAGPRCQRKNNEAQALCEDVLRRSLFSQIKLTRVGDEKRRSPETLKKIVEVICD
jgi:hypothetical protein